MKIVVISDSHGRSGKVKKILADHVDLDGIIYLGDGERDLETALAANGYLKQGDESCVKKGSSGNASAKVNSSESDEETDRKIAEGNDCEKSKENSSNSTGDRKIFLYQVRGNCDRESREAVTLLRKISGVSFYITHGYEQGVKFGLEKLAAFAKEEGCSVALYGHTHGARLTEIDGVTLFNPGSAANGSYGIIKIENGTAEFAHKEV